MIFELSSYENKKLAKWYSEHKCQFVDPTNCGAIGGRLTYVFTPTSLGVISSVRCACGEEETLTNFDEW